MWGLIDERCLARRVYYATSLKLAYGVRGETNETRQKILEPLTLALEVGDFQGRVDATAPEGLIEEGRLVI